MSDRAPSHRVPLDRAPSGRSGAVAAVAPAPVPLGGAPALPRFGVREVLPWLVFAGLLMLVAMYFVSAEQGATALLSGTGVHEWVHDGRHLLGFPCH